MLWPHLEKQDERQEGEIDTKLGEAILTDKLQQEVRKQKEMSP
jgi:hypothetical protein